MIQVIRHTILALLLCTLSVSVFAQDKVEKELIENASKLFEEKKYKEALPLYSQLLSLYNTSSEYNYKFGACKLFMESDKNEPMKYLKYAVQDAEADPEAYFFLGKGYHFNYEFDKAIKAYEKFKAEASAKSRAAYDVERQLEMCQNGKELIRNITDISVIEKKELQLKDFYRAYNVKEFGGRLLAKPDQFKSEKDKKEGESSIMFLGKDAKIVYYSGYSDQNHQTGKDIFFVRNEGEGEWSKPERMSDVINTDLDEDYPYLHPSGNILYFASKGHNSMGGYDIFKSTFIPETGVWTKPVNLDFAINTPGDDILFITDKEESVAYFSSNRASTDGKITVYKIYMERVPLKLSVIEGVFFYERTREAIITVIDVEANSEIGKFNSSIGTGEYTISLFSGRKYKFIVEPEGGSVSYQGEVNVPKHEGLKYFKQKMELVEVEGKEQLIINNLFEQEADGPLTADILKQKASLNVNNLGNPRSRVELIENREDPDAAEELPQKSDEEIIAETETIRKGFEESAVDLEKQAALAYALASEKSKDATAKTKAAQAASGTAEAGQELAEAEKLSNEAAAAFAVAKAIEKQAAKQKTNIQQAISYEDEIKSALTGGDKKTSSTKLQQLEEFATNEKAPSGSDIAKETVEAVAAKRKKELEKEQQQLADYQKQVDEIEEAIADYKQELSSTKDKALKEELQFQIDEEEKALAEISAKAEEAAPRLAELENELTSIDNQLAFSEDIVGAVNSSESAPPIPTEAEKQQINEAITQIEETIEEAAVASNNPAETSSDITEENPDTSEEETSEVADNSDPNNSSPSNLEGTNSSSGEEGTGSENADPILTEEEVTAGGPDGKDPNGTSSESTGDPAIDAINETTSGETQANNDVLIEGDYDAHFEAELEKANAIEDPLNQEAAKADIYDRWAMNVENEKKVLQAKLDDPATEAIAFAEATLRMNELEGVEEEKRELASESYQKIADLNEKEAMIAEEEQSNIMAGEEGVSDSNSGIGDGTPENNSVEAGGTTPTLEEEEALTLEELNANYVQQLTEAESITDEVERESVNKGIKEEWAAALNERAGELKVEAEAISDQEQKAELLAEAESWETAAEKVAGGEELGINEELPTNDEVVEDEGTIQNNTGNEEISQVNESEVESSTGSVADSFNEASYVAEEQRINSIEDEHERELAKTENLEKWVKAIEEARETKETELAAIPPEEVAKRETVQIEINELGKQLTAQKAKLEESKSTLASLNPDQDTVAESVPKASTTPETNSGSEEESTNISEERIDPAEIVAPAESPEQVAAKSAQPKQKIKPQVIDDAYSEQQQAEEEAAKIEADLTALRAQLNNTKKKKERAALQERINTLEQQAEEKKVMAFRAERRANLLDEVATTALSAAPGDASIAAEELAKAATLREESTKLTAEAQQLRNSSNTVKKKKEKAALMEEAIATENTAKKKEEEAVYREQLAEEIQQVEKEVLEANFIVREQDKATLPEVKKTLTPEEQKEVEESPEYEEYKAILAKSISASQEIPKHEATSKQYADEGKSLMTRSNQARNAAKELTGEEQKAELVKAEEFYKQAIQAYTNRDSARDDAKAAQARSDYYNNEASVYLNNLDDKDLFEDILAYEYIKRNPAASGVGGAGEEIAATGEGATSGNGNDNTQAQNTGNQEQTSEEEIAQNNNINDQSTETAELQEEARTNPGIPASTNNSQPATGVLKQDEFVRKPAESTEYSAAKPIPLNPPQRSGLVFKVQVGAFSKPVDPNTFKGFSPLEGESTSSAGVIRYTAGRFKTFSTADQAKQQIRDLGYSDAFVVAYLNGKRIATSEAQQMLASGNIPVGPVASQTGTLPRQGVQSGNPVAAIDLVSTSGNIEFRPINGINGLFYTVQVGVYSKPVTAAQIFNISPLNEEKTSNGYYKYSSGIYQDMNTATSARDQIREIGVKDAFVVAYRSGKKISLDEAQRIIDEEGSSALASNAGQVNAPGAQAPAAAPGVTYKIRIGSYAGQVPLKEAMVILEMSADVNVEKNGNITTYFLGEYDNFEEAQTLIEVLIGKGLSQATILAFKDGKEIGLDQATGN